ncbi:MAG TPA: agmatine deiminase family protein [Sphingomonadaceae bacterium]|nr:agmatine deiminase family protein [Sphingomonadaceae bacterium]
MTLSQPPEWAPHERVWIGFPSNANEWPAGLDAPRAEIAAFANAVHAGGRGERVVLVAGDAASADAARALVEPGVEVEEHRIGDVWLRDTGPIIVTGEARPIALDFGFNGWGGKYEMAGDEDIAPRLAGTLPLVVRKRDWVFEGGAIDVDGAGLGVTTEQCLLHPNRNPWASRAEIEARLREDLGVDRLLWLGSGLLNDHTDGHVDNLARFVAPGRIALPDPTDDDPNEAVYRDARHRARVFGLEIVPIPSAGKVERNGQIVPASYMNFYIGNAVVVVPVYGAANDDVAVAAIADLFPGRDTIGLRADAVLAGGGSFHCISQQVPRG